MRSGLSVSGVMSPGERPRSLGPVAVGGDYPAAWAGRRGAALLLLPVLLPPCTSGDGLRLRGSPSPLLVDAGGADRPRGGRHRESNPRPPAPRADGLPPAPPGPLCFNVHYHSFQGKGKASGRQPLQLGWETVEQNSSWITEPPLARFQPRSWKIEDVVLPRLSLPRMALLLANRAASSSGSPRCMTLCAITSVG